MRHYLLVKATTESRWKSYLNQMNDSKLEQLLIQHLEQDQKKQQQDQNRLNRIEDKIDKLSDTVIALARAEEKLINLEASRIQVLNTLDAHEERLDKHEARLQDGDVTLNSITKVFWIAVTFAIGSLLVVLGMPKA